MAVVLMGHYDFYHLTKTVALRELLRPPGDILELNE